MMDADNARFPLCITWTPIPMITWFLPFIGHTGLCGADGVIHDFAGPYYVSEDDFAFGECHKYVMIDVENGSLQKFQEDIMRADRTYRKRMHNICCDNCHSHVARALNNHKYRGKDNWTMVSVWWLLVTESKYVSIAHIFWTYLPFLLLVSLIFTVKFVL